MDEKRTTDNSPDQSGGGTQQPGGESNQGGYQPGQGGTGGGGYQPGQSEMPGGRTYPSQGGQGESKGSEPTQETGRGTDGS
jgi:hypothetical protein